MINIFIPNTEVALDIVSPSSSQQVILGEDVVLDMMSFFIETEYCQGLVPSKQRIYQRHNLRRVSTKIQREGHRLPPMCDVTA
ncbi:hypothetical protein BRADI_4g04916v3 [Brachypodium distachyon]|uniref:Uncharacterized protein n=1 Tax=Brachypodium distachyon TaxID=15368 RepID=A0A2K2CKJ6_BRADI|nr:hypothetical protein BRADI_4g04916v3 [Brachypodium distachyon]